MAVVLSELSQHHTFANIVLGVARHDAVMVQQVQVIPMHGNVYGTAEG